MGKKLLNGLLQWRKESRSRSEEEQSQFSVKNLKFETWYLKLLGFQS